MLELTLETELLTTKAAGEYLRAKTGGQSHPSDDTLVRWRTEGAGPTFVKLGVRVYYRRLALDRFLANLHERTHTHDNGKVSAA